MALSYFTGRCEKWVIIVNNWWLSTRVVAILVDCKLSKSASSLIMLDTVMKNPTMKAVSAEIN